VLKEKGLKCLEFGLIIGAESLDGVKLPHRIFVEYNIIAVLQKYFTVQQEILAPTLYGEL